MLINLLRRLLHARSAALDAGHYLDLAETELAAKRYAAAANHFEQAWTRLGKHDPRRAATALRVARSLKLDDDLDAAEIWFQRVLAIEPGNADALELLAFLHYNQSRPAPAQLAMQRRIAAKPAPGLELRKALMGLPAICDSMDEIDEVRARYERALDDLRAAKPAPLTDPVVEVGLTPFYLAYHGLNDRPLMEKLALACRSNYQAGRPSDHRPLSKGGKLRIGFVSIFFNNHTIARTTIGHIRDLPRDRFEVMVFAIAPGEGDMAQKIRASCDTWISLPMELRSVREAILQAQLDVLFFADIGMHPLTYYLAYSRLAPIQVSAWGHPVTSGLKTIDYFVSAQGVETYEAPAHYTETLWRLPAFFQCGYARPVLAGPKMGRAELGLPEGNLYACLQSEFKLHPDFDGAIKAILDRDPYGRILLLQPRQSGWMKRLERRFERTLGAAASRIHYLPRMGGAAYFQVVANADVVLDPFHFGGNISTAEGLALGVPAVTLPSPYARARFTAAMFREIGLEICIAGNAEDYAMRAVRLACDQDFREPVVRDIIDRCGELFERKDITFALGEKLLETAENWRAGDAN